MVKWSTTGTGLFNPKPAVPNSDQHRAAQQEVKPRSRAADFAGVSAPRGNVNGYPAGQAAADVAQGAFRCRLRSLSPSSPAFEDDITLRGVADRTLEVNPLDTRQGRRGLRSCCCPTGFPSPEALLLGPAFGNLHNRSVGQVEHP